MVHNIADETEEKTWSRFSIALHEELANTLARRVHRTLFVAHVVRGACMLNPM